MAVVWEVDRATGIVRTALAGPTPAQEIVAHVMELAELDDLPIPHRELFDLRELETMKMDIAGIRNIIEVMQTRERFVGARIAAVTERTVLYGTARLAAGLAQALGARFKVGAFRNEADAEAWLLGDDKNDEDA